MTATTTSSTSHGGPTPPSNPYASRTFPTPPSNPYSSRTLPTPPSNPYASRTLPTPPSNPYASRILPTPPSNPYSSRTLPTPPSNPYASRTPNYDPGGQSTRSTRPPPLNPYPPLPPPSPPHPPRNHNNSNNPYPYNELYQNKLYQDLRFDFIKDLWRFARTLTTASHNNATLNHVARRIVQIGLLTFEIRSLEELICRDFDYIEGDSDETKSMRGGTVKEKEDVSATI